MTTLDTPYPTTTYPHTPLHIDIPVKLTDVKSVFSVAALSFEGDLSAALFSLGLITDDIADWGAKAEVVVVFHTNAGHVTLDHPAYNADRGIETGNPYKELVANLMSRGVRVELCGATAKVHHWGNADLIPGITVNTDAMARTTQLVQQGFMKFLKTRLAEAPREAVSGAPSSIRGPAWRNSMTSSTVQPRHAMPARRHDSDGLRDGCRGGRAAPKPIRRDCATRLATHQGSCHITTLNKEPAQGRALSTHPYEDRVRNASSARSPTGT